MPFFRHLSHSMPSIASKAIVLAVSIFLIARVLSGPNQAVASSGTPLTVYGDSVASGWYEHSWDATVNTNITSPNYSGSRAISFISNAGWAGFALHIDSGVSTEPYTHLRFAARASRSNQEFAVYMEDANYGRLSQPLPLANYGGTPKPNGWKLYDIPLADLQAVNGTIYGIVIQEWTGVVQPALYVDNIMFVNNGSRIATVTRTQTSSPTVTTGVSTQTSTSTRTPTVGASTQTSTPTWTPTAGASTQTSTPTQTPTVSASTQTSTPTFSASTQTSTPTRTPTVGVSTQTSTPTRTATVVASSLTATPSNPTSTPTTLAGRNFYVSRLGNNADGQTWSTAWNELDQIPWTSLQPGDIVNLDGGSTSMTYRTQMNVQRSGTATAPITVLVSTTAGRNGQVIIDGGRTNPLPYWGQSNYVFGGNPMASGIWVRSGTSWVTIDGSKWRGIAIHGTNDSGIIFDDMTIHHVTVRNIEVYDTGAAIQSDGSSSQVPSSGKWYSDKPGIHPNGDTLLFDRMRLLDNGEDAFQIGSGGVTNLTIRSSWLFNTRLKPDGTVFNAERHQDGFQIYGGSSRNILVDRSVVGPNLMNPLIFGDSRTTVNNVSIVNTLLYGNGNAVMDGGSNPYVTGWKIDNCTIDMWNPSGGSIDLGYSSPSDDRISITNTLVTGTGGQFIAVPTGGSFTGNANFYINGIGDPIPGATTLGSSPYVSSGVIGSTALTADYRLRSDSSLSGKGAAITSPSQLGG